MAKVAVSSAEVMKRAQEICDTLNRGEFTGDETVIEALALYVVAHVWADGIESLTDFPGVARQMIDAEPAAAKRMRLN